MEKGGFGVEWPRNAIHITRPLSHILDVDSEYGAAVTNAAPAPAAPFSGVQWLGIEVRVFIDRLSPTACPDDICI